MWQLVENAIKRSKVKCNFCANDQKHIKPEMGNPYLVKTKKSFFQFGRVRRGGKPKLPIISLNSAGRVQPLHG